MDIILDTNAFWSDRHLKGSRFANIFDYLRKTDSRLVLPELVVMELREHFRRELQSATKKANDAFADIGKLTDSVPARHDVEVDKLTEAFIASFLEKLEINEEGLAPLRDGFLKDVVDRAVRRRRPCSDKGEEIRDALLWLTVLDNAQNSSDNRLAFISANVKQFAEGDNLHPHLQEDLDRLGLFVEYHTSLQGFLEHVGAKIGWLTEDWIGEHVDADDVNELAKDLIRSDYRHELRDALRGRSGRQLLDAYVTSVRLSHDVEFFVYERSDETLYVEATYYGVCYSEATYETRSLRPAWSGDYEDYDEVLERERHEEELSLSATVSFSILDQSVSDLDVLSLRVHD